MQTDQAGRLVLQTRRRKIGPRRWHLPPQPSRAYCRKRHSALAKCFWSL